MVKSYWLMKSEPDVWSLDQQKKAGIKGATWDGVRNYQARNNLNKMKVGDLCFFYHSNIGKEIVGVVKVIKKAFVDKTDKEKRFLAVQVRFVEQFNQPISLEKRSRNQCHLQIILVKLKNKSGMSKIPSVVQAKNDQQAGSWLGSASSSQERPEAART